MEAAAPAGILVIDKPAGWTSHDVVAVARRVLALRRVGHGGTLDPLATGVLPLLVGPATRSVERLHTAPKVYAAHVRFGHETTTDDAEGAPTLTAARPDLDHERLDAALDRFRGSIEQVPPAYSAVKVDGRRAYARARAGETVVMTARQVTIHRLAIAEWSSTDLRLLVVCSSGTYIRSLARDIGRALGSAAHLASLVRLAVGALTLDVAVGMETLRAEGREAACARLRPFDETLLTLPVRFHDEPADRLLAEVRPDADALGRAESA